MCFSNYSFTFIFEVNFAEFEFGAVVVTCVFEKKTSIFFVVEAAGGAVVVEGGGEVGGDDAVEGEVAELLGEDGDLVGGEFCGGFVLGAEGDCL